MLPRTRWRLMLVLVWSAIAAAILGYIVIWPLIADWMLRDIGVDAARPYRAPLLEQFRFRTFEALSAAWIFMFGATVGSFLNVVAYRMPKGESVVWRTSYCPHCHQKIRATDNIPVFGWLRLAGRCRTCHLPISARYPIVEFLTGLLFLTLAHVELLSGGTNLPGQAPPTAHHGLTRTILDVPWELIVVYAYHCVLLSALLAAALIQWDGHRVPKRMVIILGLFGLSAAAVCPTLHPVPWDGQLTTTAATDRSSTEAVVSSALGGVAGAIGGLVLSLAWLPISPLEPPRRLTTVVWVALAGLFLGWQAVVAVVFLTLLLLAVAAGLAVVLPVWNRPPIVAHLLVATLIHLCLWNLEVRLWAGA